MKLIAKLLKRIALIGTGYTIEHPPASVFGWRNRVYHLAIAFGWMSRGYQYDDRTLWQRTGGNKQARSHFRYVFTGKFHAVAKP